MAELREILAERKPFNTFMSTHEEEVAVEKIISTLMTLQPSFKILICIQHRDVTLRTSPVQAGAWQLSNVLRNPTQSERMTQCGELNKTNVTSANQTQSSLTQIEWRGRD